MSDWATLQVKEVPFWRDDMTPEEYEKERNYYNKHLDDVRNCTYIPLWKQKNNM